MGLAIEVIAVYVACLHMRSVRTSLNHLTRNGCKNGLGVVRDWSSNTEICKLQVLSVEYRYLSGVPILGLGIGTPLS